MRGDEITRTVVKNWALSMAVGCHRWNFLSQCNPTMCFSLSMRAKKGASPWCTSLNEVLLGATTFRFDGSDLMPGAIGAGAFWTGMVDYAGGTPAAEVASGVQNAWDAIK